MLACQTSFRQTRSRRGCFNPRRLRSKCRHSSTRPRSRGSCAYNVSRQCWGSEQAGIATPSFSWNEQPSPWRLVNTDKGGGTIVPMLSGDAVIRGRPLLLEAGIARDVAALGSRLAPIDVGALEEPHARTNERMNARTHARHASCRRSRRRVRPWWLVPRERGRGRLERCAVGCMART